MHKKQRRSLTDSAAKPSRLVGLVGFSACFLAILATVGAPVPAINEAHYLAKAKHALDPTFAPGDLFLDSHDSHLATTYTAGLLAQFLDLNLVAWVGRIISWGLCAWAWGHLCATLGIARLLSPIALATWILAVDYGNWAGEWAVGGFEGKSIAYPFVLLGLAAASRTDWQRGWLWFGMACIWHPLVGGWAGLSVGCVWLLSRPGRNEVVNQLPYLAGAAALALVGLWPALTGLGGTDRDGPLVASQIHVYLRLAHHLCPLTFAPERHLAAGLSLTVFLVLTSIWLWSRQQIRGEPIERMGRIILFAWFAVLFALVGLVIDVGFSRPDGLFYQPVIASKLLRFYWFRWADVAVPLASTLAFWTFASRAIRAGANQGVDQGEEQGWAGAMVKALSPWACGWAWSSRCG